ncbi:phage protein Gp36 family protein [Ohtaekwangia kribbensis]|uniref:Phage protein Gp36 family protein n=1 Tax=Ohtaekwangia kribbensis TaxID=688913 RepID=A0ABW3JV92_9BACT
MSTFLSRDDYKTQIRTYRLDQILEAADEDEEAILDDAENEAVSILKDALATKYDTDLIFSATGNARHKTVLRWAKVLVIYFIYERVPDEQIPERVLNNYEYLMNPEKGYLAQIEKGTKNIDGLPVKTVPGENGESEPKTRRRWGSVPRRANDGANYRDKRW